jgi:fructose-1,6-bisphosphatase/inositol monophosphatase family enzyme
VCRRRQRGDRIAHRFGGRVLVSAPDFSGVVPLLQQASAACILPRFRQLVDSQIHEKSPGELVTIVDREVESLMSRELARLVPGSVVVGEEACSANPDLLQQLRSERAWVVDPLDGTGNFIAGREEFAILLGYLEAGICRASWLYRPIDGALYCARRGAGATVNGQRWSTARSPASGLRGIVKTRFLPPPLRERVTSRAAARLSQVLPGANCTAFDYPEIASGDVDFALYWRTLPWDHAACVLFLEEAGGVARRLDGTEYDPTDTREGMLVARDEASWLAARAALME